MTKRLSFRKAALEAARAADEKKAHQIKLYDVRRSSTIADYVLVATVESTPHSMAVQEDLDLRLQSILGEGRRRCDGGARANWRVLDYGGLVVHLMNASARAFFDLERLWESARPVRWSFSRGQGIVGEKERPPFTGGKRGGFTLIELLLVSTIIGLLASIALPKFGNMIDKAREAALKGSLGSLRGALSIYYVDNEGLYPDYDPLFLRLEGVRALNGKYIDFGSVYFKLPRYVDGPDRSASQVYGKRPAGMDYQYQNTNPFLDLRSEAFAEYPQYVVWKESPGQPAGHAAFSLGMIYKDTKGNPWSSW